jgi:hypothetical protein
MKLKSDFIPNKEAYENFTFRLRASEAKLLNRYRAYAKEETGVEMTMPELLASIVNSFLASDREFQDWLEKAPA